MAQAVNIWDVAGISPAGYVGGNPNFGDMARTSDSTLWMFIGTDNRNPAHWQVIGTQSTDGSGLEQGVDIKDEGVVKVNNVKTLNFVGGSVIATGTGGTTSEATITVGGLSLYDETVVITPANIVTVVGGGDVVLFPAVAGKTICPIKSFVRYDFGTVAYSISASPYIAVSWSGSNAQLAEFGAEIVHAPSNITKINGGTYNANDNENKPIVLKPTFGPMTINTLGDGTFTLRMIYALI